MNRPPQLQAIPARHLSRKIAAVLDRVEIERETLLITRAGRPMATLAPLSLRPIEAGVPLVVVLSPIHSEILLTLEERAPNGLGSFEGLGDWREVGSAVSDLELDGLLERDFAGYRITERGRLVAALLKTRAEAT